MHFFIRDYRTGAYRFSLSIALLAFLLCPSFTHAVEDYKPLDVKSTDEIAEETSDDDDIKIFEVLTSPPDKGPTGWYAQSRTPVLRLNTAGGVGLTETQGIEAEPRFAFGMSQGYSFNNWRFEMNANYLRAEANVDIQFNDKTVEEFLGTELASDFTVPLNGDVSMTGIELNVLRRFEIGMANGLIKPYIGAGIGINRMKTHSIKLRESLDLNDLIAEGTEIDLAGGGIPRGEGQVKKVVNGDTFDGQFSEPTIVEEVFVDTAGIDFAEDDPDKNTEIGPTTPIQDEDLFVDTLNGTTAFTETLTCVPEQCTEGASQRKFSLTPDPTGGLINVVTVDTAPFGTDRSTGNSPTSDGPSTINANDISADIKNAFASDIIARNIISRGSISDVPERTQIVAPDFPEIPRDAIVVNDESFVMKFNIRMGFEFHLMKSTIFHFGYKFQQTSGASFSTLGGLVRPSLPGRQGHQFEIGVQQFF